MSGFVVPEGSLAELGNSSRAFNEAVQVGSYQGGYRGYGITFETTTNVHAADGVTAMNPQFGAGGHSQQYIPDFTTRVNAGDIVVVDQAGTRLPAQIDAAGDIHVQLGDGPDAPWVQLDGTAHAPSILTPLTDTAQGPDVWSPDDVRDAVDGAKHAVDAVKRPVGLATRAGKLVP